MKCEKLPSPERIEDEARTELGGCTGANEPEPTAVDDHLQGTGHRLQVGENGGRGGLAWTLEQRFALKSSFCCGRATNMDNHASTGDDNNELTVQRRVRNVLRTNC